MANDIAIDPITANEFHQTVAESFDNVMASLDIEALEDMDLQEALFMLFLNGFYQGATAMTYDPDLKETLYMMTQEIEYQTKE